MSSRGGGRRGGRSGGGGGGGEAHYGRDMPHPPSHGERGGRGRGRGGGAPPHHQERTRASDLPESSSATLSRELDERLHIGGSSGRQAPSLETPPGSPAAAPSMSGSVGTGTSLPPASSKALVHALRPGFGTVGIRCKVRANHFLVSAADRNISQYEFKINPEVKSRAMGRALMKKLIEQFGESHLGRRMAAYDGRNIFYTAGSLPFESKDFEIIFSDRDGRDKTFRVSIKFAKAFDLYSLRQFIRGEQRDCPHDVIAALDVVLRESPSNNYVTISRSFFSPEFGSDTIGEGLECWRGYFQSLRPTQMGLSLNVDISATSFYRSINLLDFLNEYLPEFRPPSLTEKQRLQIQKALKGVRVEATHMRNICRRYKITGITSQSASQLTFTLDEQGGAVMSVAQYFREKYSCSLMYDWLPCIKAGSDSKPKYLPMEVCKIVDGQRYIKKLNDRQVTQILRATCKRPQDREQSILQLVRQNNYKNDKYAKDFGIAVEPNLTTVEARVLPTPKLKYHDDGREKVCQPSVGQWNMMNKRMFIGGTVDAWACISFCRQHRDTVQNFCRELVTMCNNIGMAFNPTPVDIYFRQPSQLENSLRELHRQSMTELLKRQNQKHKQLQLLIVILPEFKGSYGKIKTICDTELGLVTQCCQPKHLLKANKQYLENLALKINVKAAGCNTVLEDALYKRIPLISDAPTIIFGADVTHPAPGEDSSSSIAAVVASMDWPFVTKYRALVSTQPHRQEIIEDLFKITADPQKGNVPGGMIRELLLSFFRVTKHKPHRILFYRDGVSEGQFNAVLLLEMEAIRKACASLEEGYLPPVTFIVVQKRHHTRLFPEVHGNRNMTDRSGNILPGTVVDKSICHPTEFDFYLCSHAGIQGTSRPAHYHVLFDENKFSADGLQILTNNLCYTFARCTRSVSVVPAAYYAHIAAFRARYYMEGESDSGSGQPRGAVTRQRTSAILTLPAIKENIKDVMFYC